MKIFKVGILVSIGLFCVLVIFGKNNFLENSSHDQATNFVVIFCDDLGYSDLTVFGHPTIKTPSLDKLANEGQKWTNFYTAASVCTPSRAGLLTGRLPVRSGMCSNKRRVLFPDSGGGLPESEITIAEALKGAGYRTAAIGKWHLGHLPQFLPTNQGFDYYFGIPYSNDMDRVVEDIGYAESLINPRTEYFNVPLIKGQEIVERPANQTTITKRYTEECIKFIKDNEDKPFFIYLAHSMPHVPLFRSESFEGKSERGTYGDVVEEIDWSVGQIIKTLEETGLDKNTLVVFTSDNGPWLIFNEHGGSAGLLKDGKGSTFDGGMRVPTVFWWKETVKQKVVTDLATTMDLLPTICKLSGVELPKDRVYDGYDISNVLLEGTKSERNEVLFYRGDELYAYRKNDYKAHFITKPAYFGDSATHHNPPLLYNLSTDPSEKVNVSDKYPDVIGKILEEVNAHEQTIIPVVNQLEIPLNE